MYAKNYLENMNKKLFPNQHRHISKGKAGDTIIYRGGTVRNSEKKVSTNSFTIGKKYILSRDYVSQESSIAYFVDHNGNFEENGHVSIVKDDNNISNGWNAALFELA